VTLTALTILVLLQPPYLFRVYAAHTSTVVDSIMLAASVQCGQPKKPPPPADPVFTEPPIEARFDDPSDPALDCVFVDGGSGPLWRDDGTYEVTATNASGIESNRVLYTIRRSDPDPPPPPPVIWSCVVAQTARRTYANSDLQVTLRCAPTPAPAAIKTPVTLIPRGQ
jgi:hypothetical protein